MVRFEDYAVFIDSVSRVYWEVTSPSKVDKNEYVSNEMKPKPTYKPFWVRASSSSRGSSIKSGGRFIIPSQRDPLLKRFYNNYGGLFVLKSITMIFNIL